MKKTSIAALVLFSALMGGASALVTSHFLQHPNTDELTSNPVPQNVHYANLSGTNLDFTKAATEGVNAVVHIKTTTTMAGGYDPFEDFFYGGRRGGSKSVGFGSGVILDKNGYIVTNNHVVQDAENIEVILNDKRSFKGKLIGRDPNTDLAVIKIEADKLSHLSFGNSDALKVGEWVLAVGNPMNLTSTVTAGIVSAKGRNLESSGFKIESYIQTDAAVNPGNSGGALINTNGELVGINTAIVSPTGAYSGYSFAIPASMVQKIVSDIMQYGGIQRGYIGVGLVELNAETAQKLGITDLKGIYIQTANSEPKLKAGDIILGINDVPVNTIAELHEQLGKHRPGEKIDVTVKRKGEQTTVPIILKNKYGETELISY